MPVVTRPGRVACMFLIRTNVAQQSQQAVLQHAPGETGCDGPTGWGTPDGIAAFSAGSPPSGGAGPVTSGISGKCLDDYTGSAANGSAADLWDCNGTAAKWTVTGGTLQASGQCLDITGSGATADGTLVELWDCNGGSNQNWTLPNLRQHRSAGQGRLMRPWPASGLRCPAPSGLPPQRRRHRQRTGSAVPRRRAHRLTVPAPPSMHWNSAKEQA